MNLDPILWLKMRGNSVYFSWKRELEVEERFSRRRKIIAKLIWEPISSVRLNFLKRILLAYEYAETQFMSIEIQLRVCYLGFKQIQIS